jgi:peptide methionine sulfoxide reductase MsrA
VRSAIIRVSVFLKEFLIFEQRLLDVLQTLEMLEKKEKVLQRKIATEIEKARDFTKAKNKRGMYEYKSLPK